jgi:hypothetical protein
MGNPSDGKKQEPDSICEGCGGILIGNEKSEGICIDCVIEQQGSSNIMGGDTGVDADDPYLFKTEEEAGDDD